MTFRFAAMIGVLACATFAGLQACGETLEQGSDPIAPDRDTGAGDVQSADSGADADPRCDRNHAFGAPVDVPISGDYSVEAARFNETRTFAYLALCPADGGKAGCDLFQSAYSNGSFGSHTPLTSVSSPYYDSYPTVTADGERLIFGSARDGGEKLFVADAVNASFASAVAREQRFDPAIAKSNEPYVLLSGNTLYFAGTDSPIDYDLYRTKTWGTGAAATYEVITELSTPNNEQAPVVSEDEEEIFFGSDRLDAAVRLELYRALKKSDGKFGVPEHLAALSKNGTDWPVWISPDRCDLYFINKDPVTLVATLRVASRR